MVNSTNIPLRWSGGKSDEWSILRTYRSDGAGENQMNGQFYEHTAPMERLVYGWDHDATNIPLRWSGGKSDEWSILRTCRSDGAEENQMNGQFYEHTAPMERVVSGWDHDATNIPLRWSGSFMVGIMMLRTYRSDGAEENQMNGQFYEHTAPMERVVFGWAYCCYEHTAPMERKKTKCSFIATNIPLRWSGGKSDEWSILRTYRSDGAARLWLGS